MPTVIDELILSLGLDSSKFQKGQKEAVDSLKKLEEQAARGGKNVEKSVGGVEESFALLQKRLIGVAALLFGGLSIDKFIDKMTKLNVVTANQAGWLGVSTQNLRSWAQAAEMAGVSGDAVAQGFGAITRQRTDWLNNRNQGGLMILQRGANAKAAAGQGTGLQLFGGADHSTLFDDMVVSERLHKWLQTEIKAGPGRGTTARAAMRDAGLPEDFITFLANPKMKEFLEAAKSLAPTDSEVQKFKDLNEAMATASQHAEALGRKFTLDLIPGLLGFLKVVTKIVDFLGMHAGGEIKQYASPEDAARDAVRRMKGKDESGLAAAIARKEAELRANSEHLADAKGIYRAPVEAEQKKLQEELKRLREELEKLRAGGVQNQSFTGGGAADGGGSLLHNIMYSGGGAAGGGGVGGGADSPSMDGYGGSVKGGLSGSRQQNAQRMYDEFRKLGWSHEQASGALAHAQAESNFSFNSSGDAGTAHGFFQLREWRGDHRFGNFMKFAKENGIDHRSPEAAARFMDWEIKNDPANAGRMVGKRLFGAKSVDEAVTALNGYERFRGYQQGQAHRYQYGRKFNNSMRPSSGGSADDAPLPKSDPRASSWNDSLNLLGASRLASYSPGANGGISTSSHMTVGDVHVHTAATDAEGIAKALKPALQRFSGVMSSNNGPT